MNITIITKDIPDGYEVYGGWCMPSRVTGEFGYLVYAHAPDNMLYRVEMAVVGVERGGDPDYYELAEKVGKTIFHHLAQKTPAEVAAHYTAIVAHEEHLAEVVAAGGLKEWTSRLVKSGRALEDDTTSGVT
jgi:hypothetical protein